MPWIIAITATLTALLFLNLYSGVKDEYSNFKSAVAKESELLRLDNERKLAEINAVTRQVESDYAKARAAMAAGPRVVRVRDTCSGTGILPANGTAATGIDATPSTGTIDPAQCETYLNAGIADATQLMWLQKFILDAHEASK
jgi:hypothetical protein